MRNLLRIGLAISLIVLLGTLIVRGGEHFRFALTMVTIGLTIAVIVMERRRRN